jgi:hypothetical protein
MDCVGLTIETGPPCCTVYCCKFANIKLMEMLLQFMRAQKVPHIFAYTEFLPIRFNASDPYSHSLFFSVDNETRSTRNKKTKQI